jgi:hypothetical protein
MLENLRMIRYYFDSSLRLIVAQNPSTTPAFLDRLHGLAPRDPDLALALVRNPNTPTSTLHSIVRAQAHRFDVVKALATTTDDALSKTVGEALSGRKFTARRVARERTTSAGVLGEVFSSQMGFDTRLAHNILRHPNADSDLLDMVVTHLIDQDRLTRRVRATVILNKEISPAIRERALEASLRSTNRSTVLLSTELPAIFAARMPERAISSAGPTHTVGVHIEADQGVVVSEVQQEVVAIDHEASVDLAPEGSHALEAVSGVESGPSGQEDHVEVSFDLADLPVARDHRAVRTSPTPTR